MSYSFYKVVHVTAIIMIFLSMGGLIVRSMLANDDKAIKRLGGITSGIGLVVALISGFGLIAKLGIGFSGWVIGKLVIWITFGGLIAFINRNPKSGIALWWVVILLGLIAATLAIIKPF